jgi:MraZ protein
VGDFFYGSYDVSFDEKGRLIIPAKIRAKIAGNTLFVTQSPDECLWVFPPEAWTDFSTKVLKATSPFRAEDREIYRQVISPSQEVEIDKAGRILIPHFLRGYANIKRDAFVLSVNTFFEVWDVETYKDHKQANRGVVKEAEKRLAELVSF